MRSIFISTSLFIVLAATSCGGIKKETGIPIYMEVERMDPELSSCFSKKLYNTWAGLHDMTPHNIKEKCTEAKPEDKHIFKSYDDFDMDKNGLGTIKIMVTADPPGGDTTNTFFQLQKFELVEQGIWHRTLNVGHFRVQDRPDDHINPGKVDAEEICDMMVKFCIKASFKD